MDDRIFSYLYPRDNDNLSNMSGKDLRELIRLLGDYYLDLRINLGFDEKNTFGVEIEFEDLTLNEAKNYIVERINGLGLHDRWNLVSDGSLYHGAEVNSPVLIDSYQTWNDLDDVCDIISDYAHPDVNSSAHVHVGTQSLGSDREIWIKFLKLWSTYENVIFRFLYGEFLTSRPNILDYAAPMSHKIWKKCEEAIEKNIPLDMLICELSEKRYQAINFLNVDLSNSFYLDNFEDGNTVEFRCPNGTLNPIIWQNNVNLILSLIKYAKNEKYDEEKVANRRKLNKGFLGKIKYYDEIFLDEALELADMIFDNNLDKVYFLKQYLKSFRITKNRDDFTRGCVLTKKLI